MLYLFAFGDPKIRHFKIWCASQYSFWVTRDIVEIFAVKYLKIITNIFSLEILVLHSIL